MKQSRRSSLIETITNTVAGYGIALSAQIIIFPWFGIHIPLHSNIAIGLIFTLVSIGRGFVMRRVFETLRVKGVMP